MLAPEPAAEARPGGAPSNVFENTLPFSEAAGEVDRHMLAFRTRTVRGVADSIPDRYGRLIENTWRLRHLHGEVRKREDGWTADRTDEHWAALRKSMDALEEALATRLDLGADFTQATESMLTSAEDLAIAARAALTLDPETERDAIAGALVLRAARQAGAHPARTRVAASWFVFGAAVATTVTAVVAGVLSGVI